MRRMACPVICINQLESIIVFWLMLCFNVDSVCCYPATATQPSSSGSNNSSSTIDDNSDRLLSVLNKSAEDVIELILSNNSTRQADDSSAHSSSSSSTSMKRTHSAEKNTKETIPVNLDETREKLLQALKNEATFLLDNSDEFSHEKMNLNTISAEKLRSTLEQFLRKQIDEVQLRTDTNIDGDSSDSRIDDGISNSSAVATTTSSSNRSAPSPPDGATLSSQLICQFFVFGTLFGVVCSISTCTCCLHPRTERQRNAELSGVNPTNIPAPIDYNKPYMLKCDSRGTCYASPLNDDEVPPLPSYAEALSCATKPAPKSAKSSHSTSSEPSVV